MQYAIRRAGGQSRLAREIELRYKIKTTQQRLQYLASETRRKPAKGSRITPQIAGVAGLRAEWLATGIGPREETPTRPRASADRRDKLEAAAVVDVKIKDTTRILRMELTQDAIDVAKAFMDLPARERMRFQRAILVAALPHTRDIPDEALGSLAAPTAKTQKKKLLKGTQ
jgi:hypothetical protein